MGVTILVVEDDHDLRDATCRMLRAAGYETLAAESGVEALSMLEDHEPDLVLLDVHMPGMSGIDVLCAMRERGDTRAVIMISAAATIDLAVRATQLGAHDFLEKPARAERLRLSIDNALRFSRLSREHDDLRAQLGPTSELVGSSRAMEEVRQLIRKIAPTDARVLIVGENGTGKELAARAIHGGSARHALPFVQVNCGAIPSELIESELFGHEKGAFTGAIAQRLGKFELANRGTLLLDEIGDMPTAMQVKLLRVLQEGCFERVGGAKTVHVDVRVLAATHRDLETMVHKGEFREDLYYRLDVVRVRMPPLRDRHGDIAELAQVLLKRACKRSGGASVDFSADALDALSKLPFPGNVRELGNMIERLLILSSGPQIRGEDVRRCVRSPEHGHQRVANDVEPLPTSFEPGTSYRDRVRAAERQILESAIRAFNGNKSAAARALGLERAHFAKKCRAVGIVGTEPSLLRQA